MHLSSIDVNLVVVLRALLETGNVTQAGRRIGLSPSATSHALGRLRGLFGDPLLVRSGRRLVPTPRALSLTEPVTRALEALESALAPQTTLEPRTLERSFRIETTDHVQFVLLRALDALVSAKSPGVNVYLQSLQSQTFARLREGDIDLAISVHGEVDSDIERQVLFEDRLVAVVRRGHPALRRRMTLARLRSSTSSSHRTDPRRASSIDCSPNTASVAASPALRPRSSTSRFSLPRPTTWSRSRRVS